MKTQWRYECACGFKIWHTVAKVELSEEVMKELLTTGKTKQKIDRIYLKGRQYILTPA